uniref:YdeI/OmpD-associated family protein n=1 Tax=uncultured Draconibacterium sp. TaxID=1573823 RepID=UPI003216DE62
MAKKFSYETVLINGPFKGVYAEFPFDSVAEFGTKKHVWCKVEVDGTDYSMNLLPNGKGGHWIHLKKDILTSVGKREGDNVKIGVERDTAPRTIEIPEYLQWLLDNDPEMADYFNKMPVSAKKFWVGFIEEPKNDDIKVKRINRLFEYLHEHYAGKT